MVDEFDYILRLFRAKIDTLDDQIVDLLVQREALIREVSNVKYEENVPAVLQKRVDEVRERAISRAKKSGTDGQYIEDIYRHIIKTSCDLEDHIFNEKKKS